MDVDIDVDGEDEFGEAQFTEQDILTTPGSNQDHHVELESGDEDITDGDKTLRDLVSEGKVIRKTIEEVSSVRDADRLDSDVQPARQCTDPAFLIKAFKERIQYLVGVQVIELFIVLSNGLSE